MSVPGPPTIIRKKKRRSRGTPIFPFVILGVAAVAVYAGSSWLSDGWTAVIHTAKPPEAYISTPETVEEEFKRYHGPGKVFDKEAGEGFRSAADLAARKNLPAVASVLDSVSKVAAVPVVFHNLGVAYAGLLDWTRAADAFREALARDPEYAPTRKFLGETPALGAGVAEPYTHEHEPNDNNTRANVIASRASVEGEIAGASDAADYYRVAAPAAPRDLLAIDLTGHSPGFAPHVRVFDETLKIQSWGEKSVRAGETLTLVGCASPNSTLYVAVTDDNGAGGAYRLTVTPQKAFDRYEPNEEISESRPISTGEDVSGNVMDKQDTDFFSFVSPRRGAVTVEIRNANRNFVPALSVYNSNRRNVAFAREIKAETGVRHTFDADKDLTYYVRISSQAGSSGAYILRVD